MVEDREARAEQLVGQAEAALQGLGADSGSRFADRLRPQQIGRAIVLIGCAAGLALIGATVAIVLVIVQFSTRVDIAERAAQNAVQQSEQTRAIQAAATCDLFDLFRVHPGEPLPTPGRGQTIANRVDAAWTAWRCG